MLSCQDHGSGFARRPGTAVPRVLPLRVRRGQGAGRHRPRAHDRRPDRDPARAAGSRSTRCSARAARSGCTCRRLTGSGARPVFFFLSKDGSKSADDASLGNLTTPKLKPKRKKAVSGAFALPAGVQPGVYRLIACADVTGVVRERKEQNNCQASRTSISLPGGPGTRGQGHGRRDRDRGRDGRGQRDLRWLVHRHLLHADVRRRHGDLHAHRGCGVYQFTGWSGVHWLHGDLRDHLHESPTESKDCTAGFVRLITVSWSVNNPLWGTVAFSGRDWWDVHERPC